MFEKTKKHSSIDIYGAREHYLKDLTFSLPRNSLIVFTGVSGSGKSSLAFDTIYAEAERRYMETFSSYASTFLGGIKRPDVDKIDGLSPAISIEQKTTSKNPKSTVGTVTDIYDFLRLLYAKTSSAYTADERVMVRQSESEVLEIIGEIYNNQEVSIFANVVNHRKGTHKEILEKLIKEKFVKVKVDGKLKNLTEPISLNRYQAHSIDVLVGKIHVDTKNNNELKKLLSLAWKYCDKSICVIDTKGQENFFSKDFVDPKTGLSYPEPSANTFSFNSPQGACQKCQGLGLVPFADLDKLIPNKDISFGEGAIVPLGKYKKNYIYNIIECILKEYGYTIDTPIKKIAANVLDKILYGCEYTVQLVSSYDGNFNWLDDIFSDDAEVFNTKKKFDGLIKYLKNKKVKPKVEEEEEIELQAVCDECNGTKLKKTSLVFKIGKKSIADLAEMNLKELSDWILNINKYFTTKQQNIAKDILREMNKRLSLLLNMGLDYLQLNRSSITLSGGENQRVRLATQIGTELLGVLYILDEPSIGLHPKDNEKLISALKTLKNLGNTIIVVEHDKEIMLEADYILDIGPGAGVNGGEIVGSGSPKEFLNTDTDTAKFLSGDFKVIEKRNPRSLSGEKIVISNCRENNLQNVTLEIPLGVLVCVTGVSGSGKSTLINSTLVPVIKNKLYSYQYKTGKYDEIVGVEKITDIVEIDQKPIGRTPRSCAATYTGVFGLIRVLYTQLPEAKVRGYSPGRFSFNVQGGRCDDCDGAGVNRIEMNFMENVHVTCTTCRGKRYNRETLEVKYHGKSISDVLDMTVDQATLFFGKHPQILKKLETLQMIGLGYLALGQHATTISGGEAQRLKLSTELCKRGNTKTLYVLDEPTTGLHFSDIKNFLEVINVLIDKGNSVIIVEHNLDVICASDYIVDLGPDSGPKGGHIIATGTPEKVANDKNSITGQFIGKELSTTKE